MKSIIKKINNKKGQALTELIFILPILFLIFLFALQMIDILNEQNQAQMSVWLGVRGPSLRKFEAPVFFKRKYSESEVKDMIEGSFYLKKHGEASIKYEKSAFYADPTLQRNTYKIEYEFPFLLKSLKWAPIEQIFNNTWVEGNKVKVKAEGKIAQTFAL